MLAGFHANFPSLATFIACWDALWHHSSDIWVRPWIPLAQCCLLRLKAALWGLRHRLFPSYSVMWDHALDSHEPSLAIPVHAYSEINLSVFNWASSQVHWQRKSGEQVCDACTPKSPYAFGHKISVNNNNNMAVDLCTNVRNSVFTSG